MKKKKIRRWVWGVVGGMVLLLLLVQATFLFFGDEILKKSILMGFQRYSQEAFAPARQPELNFDNLSINPLNGKLSLSGLYFAGYLPSQDEGGAADYIRLQVPEAHLLGLDLIHLYQERRVSLKNIIFQNPDIQLLKAEKADSLKMDPQESIRVSTASLHRLVRLYLKSFSFDELQIEDGNLFVTSQTGATPMAPQASNRFHAEHVYISLYDFMLDSLSLEQTDRIFFTKDFKVQLGDYQILAPDSSYLIQSDTLGYSSRDQEVYLKNFRAFPLQKDSVTTQFYLSIPQISLTEVNWQEIYFDSLFLADQLIVDQPFIQLSTPDRPDSLKRSAGFQLKQLSVAQLYNLFQNKIKLLEVNDLLVKKGRLELEQTGKDTLDLLNIQDISMLLANIRMDSLQQGADSLYTLFPADTLMLDLRKIRFYLPDRKHYLTTARAILNTNRQRNFVCDILLDSIDFKPGYDSLEQLLLLPPQQPLAYEVHISQLRFDGIQLEAFNQQQAAILDSIYIRSPDIRIANFTPQSLGKRATGIPQNLRMLVSVNNESIKSLLYDWSHARLNLRPFIAPGDSSAFLQWLHAGKLQLDSGSIHILKADTQRYAFVPVTSVDTFYTFLSNIRIDHLPDDSLWRSTEGRVAVRATDVDLFIQQGEFRLPGEKGEGGILRVDDGRVSTLSQEVYLRNVYFWTNPGYPPNTDFWLHSLYVPYVQLREIDLQKLYYKQVAEARSLSGYSPQLTFNYHASGMSRSGLTFEFENLYPQFSNYLNKIDLKWVSLSRGELTIRKIGRQQIDSLFVTRRLNLELNQFYIDSLTRMSRLRPFYAHNLDLQLDDFRWNFLSDNTDERFQGLTGKRLHYNAYEGQLDAVELKMLINTDADARLDRLNLRSQKVMADDIDPYQLIHGKRLHVGRLIVQQPFFALAESSGTRVDNNTEGWKSLQPDLNSLLSPGLKQINLRYVHVENGKLKYLRRSGRDTLAYVGLDSVDFMARNIQVDGSQKRHLHHILYADDVDYTLISEELLFKPEEKHEIRIDRAYLSSRDSYLHLRRFGLLPSPALRQNPNATHIEMQANALTMNGLDLNRAYLYGDLKIQRVLPSKAVLQVHYGKSEQAPASRSASIHDILGPYIKSIQIDEFSLPQAELTVSDKLEKQDIFHSSRVAAKVSGFQLDQELLDQAAISHDRMFYADDIRVNIRDYARTIDEGLYRLMADEIEIGTAEKDLRVVNFRMQPQLNRQQYLSRFKYSKSLATIYADLVSLEGLDYEALLNHQRWRVNQVKIMDPVLEVLRDNRLPRDESRRPLLHQQMLFQMDQSVRIDRLLLHDGYISYAERVPEAEQDGVISFHDVNVEIRNLTNEPEAVDASQTMEMEVNAMVLGEGKLNAYFNFPLDTNSMKFSIRGTLGPMNLTQFNQILGPVAFVHVKEGFNQNMQFEITGDHYKTSGTMEFRYNDLSVLMIDKEKGQAGLGEKLGSFIANAFVLKANNPKAVFLRIGNIGFERDPSRAMFHYWWQSILSGVKSSIGLEKNTEKTKDFTRMKENENR